MYFVEFSNMHNDDGSFNATQPNLSKKDAQEYGSFQALFWNS